VGIAITQIAGEQLNEITKECAYVSQYAVIKERRPWDQTDLQPGRKRAPGPPEAKVRLTNRKRKKELSLSQKGPGLSWKKGESVGVSREWESLFLWNGGPAPRDGLS